MLHVGRLLQQYMVDMYIKLIRNIKIRFFCNKQHEICVELYQGIVDSIRVAETRGNKIRRRIVLPSFIGGPRDMCKRYVDAMALVQQFGKPHIFLTMT